jgi:hypothetical protein
LPTSRAGLLAHALRPATHRSYTRWFSAFTHYCRLRDAAPPTSYRDLDHELANFIFALFRARPTRGQRQAAIYSIAAVTFFCSLPVGHLRASQRLVSAWDRLIPAFQGRYPLTAALAHVIAFQACRTGQTRFACIVILAFYSFARISEFLAFLPGHLAIDADLRLGALARPDRVGVLVPVAKTGRNQFMSFSHPVGAAAARWLLAHTQPGSPLAGGASAQSFRATLRSFTGALGLPPDLVHHFSPHSLRIGGATDALGRGEPISDIRFRGRWSTTKALEGYLQSARAHLIASTVSPDVQRLADLIASRPALIIFTP